MTENGDTNTNLELVIRLSNGTRLHVEVANTTPTTCTVFQVKQQLCQECPVDRQRLIYKGRILEDDRTLQDYAIASKSTLFLVKGQAPTSPPPSAANVTPPTATTRTTNAAPNPWGSSTGSSNSNNNSSGLMGNNNDSMMGMMNNPMINMNPNNMDPNQMQQMMNSPMMQSLLDNPQLMQSMMEMQMQTNPQLRQLMENNPQIRQALSDPETMRQMTDMMRNPAAMQQAMRNQDLAMQNIENMPGGFAALSSMYRDIQEPLEDSMQNNNTATPTSNTNSQLDAGASGSAMPNPWGDNARSSNNTVARNSFSGLSSSSEPTPAANNPWAQPSSQPANNNNNSSLNNNSPVAAPNPFASMMMQQQGMGGGMPPPSVPPSQDQMNAALQMMENPMIQQLMQQTLQDNPGMVRQMLEQSNPVMAQMFRNNPEAAQHMVRTMTNPDVLRSMMQMQQAFGSMNMGSGSTSMSASGNMGAAPPPLGGNIGGAPPLGGGMDFSALLQQMNGGGTTGSPFVIGGAGGTPQAPADRYRNQLRSLYDMGFDDEQQCLAALQASHGNVNRAVDMLLGGEVPASAPPPPAAPAATTTEAETNSNENTEQEETTTPETNDKEEDDGTPKDANDKKND